MTVPCMGWFSVILTPIISGLVGLLIGLQISAFMK